MDDPRYLLAIFALALLAFFAADALGKYVYVRAKRRLPCGHTEEEHAAIRAKINPAIGSFDEKKFHEEQRTRARDNDALRILCALIASPLLPDEKRSERDPRLLVGLAFGIANEFAVKVDEKLPIVSLEEAAEISAQATHEIVKALRPVAVTVTELQSLRLMSPERRNKAIAEMKAKAKEDMRAADEAYRQAREREEAERTAAHVADQEKHRIFAAAKHPTTDAKTLHEWWQLPVPEFRAKIEEHDRTAANGAAESKSP